MQSDRPAEGSAGIAPAEARSLRACLYRKCGRVGADVVRRAVSDAGGILFDGTMCDHHARALRAEPLLIVEDLEDEVAA